MFILSRAARSDEEVVEQARRLLAATRRFRWMMLPYAAVFLGLCCYLTFAGIRKLETLDIDPLNMVFVYGFALAIVWMSFGILGALCLGKFLVGVGGDYRPQQLLVRYHDHLRELGQLAKEENGQRDAPASETQQETRS